METDCQLAEDLQLKHVEIFRWEADISDSGDVLWYYLPLARLSLLPGHACLQIEFYESGIKRAVSKMLHEGVTHGKHHLNARDPYRFISRLHLFLPSDELDIAATSPHHDDSCIFDEAPKRKAIANIAIHPNGSH